MLIERDSFLALQMLLASFHECVCFVTCMLHACTYSCVYLTFPTLCSFELLHHMCTCRELLASLVYPIPSGISVVTSEPIYYIKESTTSLEVRGQLYRTKTPAWHRSDM